LFEQQQQQRHLLENTLLLTSHFLLGCLLSSNWTVYLLQEFSPLIAVTAPAATPSLRLLRRVSAVKYWWAKRWFTGCRSKLLANWCRDWPHCLTYNNLP